MLIHENNKTFQCGVCDAKFNGMVNREEEEEEQRKGYNLRLEVMGNQYVDNFSLLSLLITVVWVSFFSCIAAS